MKIWGITLLATVSAAAGAQPIAETHQQVSTPGKSTIAYRPIEQRVATASKCHPDATKAVACEAHAQMARAQAWADANRAEASKLTAR